MNRSLLNVTPLNASLLNMVGRLTSGKKGGASFADAVISGTDILRISNAKANSLSSLVLGGGCSQSGTPTPTAPKSLISNKGAISYGVLGNNLLEVTDANIVVGKYINNNGEVTTSLPNLYFQRFVAVKANTAYTLSTSEALNYANFMEYDADGVFIKRTLYGSSSAPAGKAVTHTMGASTAFVIVGSNINATKHPEVTKDVVKGIKWMFNEGSSAKTYEAYRAGYSYGGEDGIEVYGKNLSVGELIGKGYASTGSVSTSTTFCGNLHKIPCKEGQKFVVSWGNLPDGLNGVFVNTWKTDGSWNARQAISASDSLTFTIPSGVGEVNFTLYKTGGITIAEDTWMQVELGETATPYEPSIAPTTISITSLLLGVGDYADAQDIIKGVITRKVGIKVLDGFEDITKTSGVYLIDLGDKKATNDNVLCSHFSFIKKTSVSSHTNNLTISSMSNSKVTIRYNAIADEEAFRQFLHREYAKGTPVIVVYPLATETTESVTPQTLSNPKGEVTIVRDAEVSGLPMEATIKVKSEGGGEIEFTITDYNGSADGTFKAREGMTWREFCDSEYNTEGWHIDETAWVYLYEGEGWGNPAYYAYEQDYGLPIADRVINPNAGYFTHQEGGIGGGGM